MKSRLLQRKPEVTLEDFFINRFGDKLYRTFFKDYTEKVWGVPCAQISAEWGAQRIKGLSITKALVHALLKPFRSKGDTRQKDVETSLIERFLYPKFGPGQMWEEATKQVTARGGEVHLQHRIVELHTSGRRVTGVTVRDERDGSTRRVDCDQFVSTMPVKELTAMLRPDDSSIAGIASALALSRFHDGRPAGQTHEAQRRCHRQQRHAAGQLDLRAGAGCETRAPADLQQLESLPGRRSVHRLAGPRVLLRRGRLTLVDA